MSALGRNRSPECPLYPRKRTSEAWAAAPISSTDQDGGKRRGHSLTHVNCDLQERGLTFRRPRPPEPGGRRICSVRLRGSKKEWWNVSPNAMPALRGAIQAHSSGGSAITGSRSNVLKLRRSTSGARETFHPKVFSRRPAKTSASLRSQIGGR
jgi:hypothetical protein